MTESQNIEPVNIENEIEDAYVNYALSVIRGRALPDVRDGLKPVHRRIIYALDDLGIRWDSAHKKSARVVGEVIGKYHPHGDAAVYNALVRMAQDFNMRVPLVDGQGNFGSIDGDPAAAMRYTEVRLENIVETFVEDLKKKQTVDWNSNYDDSEQEPSVLPVRVPNLLVNGSSGIAVGMSTNIPPHNLGEVVEATLALIDNPDLTTDELIDIVPGPDFPTGGLIYGTKGIHEAYKTGRGVIKMRAKVDIEEMDNDKSRLVVNELPYQVNKARLIEKIAELVQEDKIDGVTDIRDESDRNGYRVVIELRRDVIPEITLNNLYKMTQLQSSFGIIMMAIVHEEPKVMGLKEVIQHFIDFRRDVTRRRTLQELEEAEARAHILEGLKKALDNLDRAITIIRESSSPKVAKESLETEFDLTGEQSDAILKMRLQKLTGLERQKVLDELGELREEIARLRGILKDEDKLLQVIKDEIEDVSDKYADERRTEIQTETADITIEDLIAEEDMVVTMSHEGYIKRTPLDEYRAQRRGGRGKRGMSTKDEDFVADLFVASTHTNILFFSSFGKIYKLRTHELPEGSRNTKGQAAVNLLPLEQDEKIQTVLPVDEFEEGPNLVFATRHGRVKKTPLIDYENVRSTGIIALKLKDDDEVISVRLSSGDDDIMLTSRNGRAIRFHEEDVRSMGRTAMGVIGMRFKGEDEIVSMDVIKEDRKEDRVLIITENGYGKRTNLDEYPQQSRGGVGVITIKTTDRNGRVVGARIVESSDDLMLVTNQGQILRTPVEELSVYGRNTQGVTVMNTANEEHVVSLARLPEPDKQEQSEAEDTEDDGEN